MTIIAQVLFGVLGPALLGLMLAKALHDWFRSSKRLRESTAQLARNTALNAEVERAHRAYINALEQETNRLLSLREEKIADESAPLN